MSRNLRPVRRAALVLAAALVVAGLGSCGGGRAARSGRAVTAAGAGPDSASVVLTPTAVDGVLAAARQPGARVTLVHVWATWCIPCREEFPGIVRLHRELAGRGLRLVLVSADFDDQAGDARKFLASEGVDFPSFIRTGDDQTFIDTLSPQWSGALPASFLYDARGHLVRWWEGKTPYDTLRARVLPVLRAAPAPPVEGAPS